MHIYIHTYNVSRSAHIYIFRLLCNLHKAQSKHQTNENMELEREFMLLCVCILHKLTFSFRRDLYDIAAFLRANHKTKNIDNRSSSNEKA